MISIQIGLLIKSQFSSFLQKSRASSRSLELNLDRRNYGSSYENQDNSLYSQIPVTTKQKISVSLIEKVIGILSFVVGKITKADKVEKNKGEIK